MSKWVCAKCSDDSPCYFDGGNCERQPTMCPLDVDGYPQWEPAEQFGNSEQLPKLTEEVFNRPDCPEEATFAIVYQNGSAAFFRGNCYDIKPSERGWGYSRSSGVYQLCEIPGNWDASDWQHSLVRRPKPTTDGKLHIRFKKLHKDAKAPYQGTPGSAGYDLTAVSKEEFDWVIRYGTGLAVEIPAAMLGWCFRAQASTRPNCC